MPDAVKFLEGCTKLQEASGAAKELPDAKTMALFAVAELLKVGFLVDAKQEKKEAKVPEALKTWATDVNKWAVSMHNAYKTPTQVVNPKHIAQGKEWITKGNKLIPPKHKGLTYLSVAAQKFG